MSIEDYENYVETLAQKTRDGLMHWKATSHPEVDPQNGCYHCPYGCVDLLLIGGSRHPSVSIVDRNGRFISSRLSEINANELWIAVEENFVGRCLAGREV